MSDNKKLSRINSYSNVEILLSPSSKQSTTITMTPTSNQINGSLLAPPVIKPRKYSLPLICPNQLSPNDYLESSTRELRRSQPSTFLDSLDFNSQKKRLSNVGIAVSHHLSATIGWKLLASHKDIVNQSKCLCSRFIRFKLRECGHKRINLQKIKSLCNITLDSTTSQVAVELKYLILELERSYPKLYTSVFNNINSQSLKSASGVQTVLQTMAQELFRNDITWPRIAAFFAVAGALSVDCVRIGHPEYIMSIIETFTTFIDRDIAGYYDFLFNNLIIYIIFINTQLNL
jgi:hypothetical protein